MQCSAMQCSSSSELCDERSEVGSGQLNSRCHLSPHTTRGRGNVDLDADNNCLGAAIFGKGGLFEDMDTLKCTAD